MEKLYNGFTLDFPEGAFSLSTDSMLLWDFTRLPRNARVLDLVMSGVTFFPERLDGIVKGTISAAE